MRGTLFLLLIWLAGPVLAGEGVQLERLGFGGGFGSTTVPEFSETKSAVQIYATYRTDGMYGMGSKNLSLSAELGYIDVSDTPRDGFWLTPVVAWHATDLIDLLFRAGLEYGDDIGGVVGAGVSYQLERNMAVRLEYTKHPNANTVQLNVVYYPWSLPF
jgi:hypothetical protein